MPLYHPYVVKNTFKTLMCLLLFLVGKALSAQLEKTNYFEQHFLFQERLAKGLVFDILQDQQGFLWFATEYGLVRYDGVSQKTYQHDPVNPYSLAGNVITSLAEDAKGNLWVGTMNSGLHYFDRNSDQFFRFQYDAEDHQSIANNRINEILVTTTGGVWVATEGGGAHLFKTETQQFKRFQRPSFDVFSAFALLEDKAGQIWLGDYFGLNRWSSQDSTFTLINQVDKGTSLTTLTQEDNGRIWAGFQDAGLVYLDTNKQKFQFVSTIPQWPNKENTLHIWDIHADQQNLWVATDGGLFHLEKRNNEAAFALSPYTLTKERRYLSLCKSRDGVMWIGTNDGVVVIVPRIKQFKHFIPQKTGEPASTKRGVTSMCRGQNKQIWVGTIRGLFQFDSENQQFHRAYQAQHKALNRFEDANISAIYQDRKGLLWLATIEGFNIGFGLFCYDPTEKKLYDFSDRSLLFHSYPTFSITEDPFGNLWFGNGNGLIRYSANTDSMQLIPPTRQKLASIGRNQINILLPSDQLTIWVGTNDASLAQYHLVEEKLQHVSLSSTIEENAFNKRILSLFEDRKKQLWLGTAGGLLLFDQVKKTFRRFDNRNGLVDNVIKNISQDFQGRIWISSQSHLARFDDEKEIFINFSTSDGLEMEEFWDRSNHRDENGRLYFGGDDGLLIFHPDSIKNNQFLPPVVFTHFHLFNQEVSSTSHPNILPAPLHQNPSIRLYHHQNVFTIFFAALSYIDPEKTQYAIKMEGFQEDWQFIGHKTEATYTNLDPGTYFFRVKAANNDGQWNEKGAALKIIVLPPWYGTWWAYLLYFTTLISGSYLFYHFQLNRRLALIETRRLRELDEVKTQLYTNITHEFRTPLTLIQGPVERAINEFSFSLGKNELEQIRQNCRRLLRLIQQMLDLNKLETGVLKPNYQYGDIIHALKYITDSFSSYAKSQQIKLEMELLATEIFLDYDQEKLFDILSNLLSNAIKFTPPNGTVKLEAKALDFQGKKWLEIKVEDTGPGILAEELNKIFDRFYQSKSAIPARQEEVLTSGSGIGLALSQRLAKLMEGSLSAESTAGEGSRFYLRLPIRHTKKEKGKVFSFKNIYVPGIEAHQQNVSTQEVFEQSESPLILIVEDNADVAHFIWECLPKHYQKIMAVDGRQGVELAIKHIPDLIISDVLMPKADGYTLTKTIKQDQRTSHIPIILLTAKADFESKIFGLEKGADAYMAKPFNRQELLIRIENLLDSRRRLQTYYLQQSGLLAQREIPEQTEPQEHIFLKTIRQLIEDRIQSETYSIEALSKDLHMSPSQLYRKMMALTGQSPSKFFRHIQISKAKQLLIENELNIADIAYQCGFNEPAYFTRVFIADVGIPPSTFRTSQT